MYTTLYYVVYIILLAIATICTCTALLAPLQLAAGNLQSSWHSNNMNTFAICHNM